MSTPRFYNCYQDQELGLSPKSTRLVFKAVVFHGSGHDEGSKGQGVRPLPVGRRD